MELRWITEHREFLNEVFWRQVRGVFCVGVFVLCMFVWLCVNDFNWRACVSVCERKNSLFSWMHTLMSNCNNKLSCFVFSEV